MKQGAIERLLESFDKMITEVAATVSPEEFERRRKAVKKIFDEARKKHEASTIRRND